MLNQFINSSADEELIKSLPTEGIPEHFIKSMNRAGLVQKQVTVHGKNGDYQAMKWVRTTDDKADVGVVKVKPMTESEFKKKYPNGYMQNPEDCLKYNGSNATWHGEKLQNPYVMKKAKEEYAQFKKDKEAMIADTKSKSNVAVGTVLAVRKGSETISVKVSAVQSDSLGDTVYEVKSNDLSGVTKTMKVYPRDIVKVMSETKTSTGAEKVLGISSDDLVKFDKTKSGKVGGIQVGKELAAVVKTAPTGAKKLREVTDNDTGKTYSIYTDTSSNKPDGIVAVENTSSAPKKEEKKPEAKSATDSKMSKADAKAKTQSYTSKIGKTYAERSAFIDKVKAAGITWKENDKPGINWMRCCMAMNSHFENGGTFDDTKPTHDNPLVTTDTKSGKPYQIWEDNGRIYGSLPGEQNSHDARAVKDFTSAGFNNLDEVKDYIKKYF